MDLNRLNMENKVKWQTLKYEEFCKAQRVKCLGSLGELAYFTKATK